MYPILIEFGPFSIRYYGVLIAVAFIVGTILGAGEARRKGIDPNLVYDFAFYLMIASLAGARVYYILFEEGARRYLENPIEIFMIWNGGLAIHGGLLGGLILGIFYTWKRRIRFWLFADTLAPAIILGQAIGRVGCTLNGCSFGKATDLPWAITFRDPNALAPLGVPLHPTQVYELIGDLIIFAFIFLRRKKKQFEGQLFVTYAISYGVLRFFVEFYRGDKLYYGPFPAAQALSLMIVTGGIIAFLVLRRRSQRLALSYS